MKPSRRAPALAASLLREGMNFATRPSRGIPVVMVPAEHVHMAVLDLPLASARKRLAAAPFAMEEALAESIDTVHVALGPQVAPNRHAAAAVSRGRMAAWVAALAEAGLDRARLVPDALTLPLTPDGWTVGIMRDRALVRREDGTAFAASTSALPLLWRAAGQPALRAFGDDLPPAMTGAERIAKPATPSADALAFDLRQGDFAAGGGRADHGWLRAAAIVLAAGGIAHGAIDVADARIVQGQAAQTREDAGALLARIAPDARATADPVGALARYVPTGQTVRQPGFLDLFARASDALGDAPVAVAVTALAWAAEDGALTLDVELADLPALEQVGAAFGGAGLTVETGPAATANGATTARLVIREAGR